MNLSFTAAEKLWNHLLRAIVTIVEYAARAANASMRFRQGLCSKRFCVHDAPWKKGVKVPLERPWMSWEF